MPFKFRFNSVSIFIYFIISVLCFVALLVFIWELYIKNERSEKLNHDAAVISQGVFSSVFAASELKAKKSQQWWQTVIQESLSFTFGLIKDDPVYPEQKIVGVNIYSLMPHKELLGTWTSKQVFSSTCIEKQTKYFQIEKPLNLYLLELTFNICAYHPEKFFAFRATSILILMFLVGIFLWGICIMMMLYSVRYAVDILDKSENIENSFVKSNKIKWTNIKILSQKALRVKGKNFLFFQNLILDMQHDVSKILDTIERNYKIQKNKEVDHSILMLRSIVQRLTMDVRSSENNGEHIDLYKEFDSSNMILFLKLCFGECKIQNELPVNCKIPMGDVSLFERILINLSSNAEKYANKNSYIRIFFENNHFCLHVCSSVSCISYLKILFAKWTGRIDIEHPNVPVYLKFFGRTGRGLSIVKRGILQLGGTMIFLLRNKMVEIGFKIPAFLEEKDFVEKIKNPNRKRVIFFNNEEFIDKSIECGLKNYIVTKTELSSLIKKAKKDEKLEIVSDENIDLPDPCVLKLVTKMERIEGLAMNWVGEVRL